jgi:hypothetical protein
MGLMMSHYSRSNRDPGTGSVRFTCIRESGQAFELFLIISSSTWVEPFPGDSRLVGHEYPSMKVYTLDYSHKTRRGRGIEGK